MAAIRIFPPLLGVSESASYTDQEPMTARDAENVVSLEPRTGRTRLAKRPGLPLFVSTALGTGKVRDINQVVYNNISYDWSAYSIGSETQEWTAAAPNVYGLRQALVSGRGDIFCLGANKARVVARYNADGALINTIPLSTEDKTGYFNCMALDDADGFYVGLSSNFSGATTGDIRLAHYKLGADGEYYRAWVLRADGSAPDNIRAVKSMWYAAGTLYTLQDELDEGITTSTDVFLRVYENVDGNVAPRQTLDVTVHTGTAAHTYAKCVTTDESGAIFVAWIDDTVGDSWVRKYNPSGGTLWTLQGSVVNRGGLGLAVAARDGYVYTMGDWDGTDHIWLSMYTDGDTPVHQWDATNTATTDYTVTDYKLFIDAFDNVHAIYPTSINLGAGVDEYFCYNTSGTKLNGISAVTVPSSVAIPPTNPDYDASTTSPARPACVYLTNLAGSLYKYNLAHVSAASGTPRAFAYVAAADTDIVSFTSSSVSSPTSGSGVLATAGYVQSVAMFGKVHFADGEKYWTYDPVLEEVEELVSSTSGAIPPRCTLIDTWRSRLVLAGDPDNRHAVYMSAQGDPTDWDFYPPTPNGKQAIWTALTDQMGHPSDIVTCLFPYSNDWLLVGCDHSLWLVRGDPAAGGTIDLISSSVGMAYGRPACFGPNGELFFMANQGGVYVMNPGLSIPQSLSEDRIGRQLRDVDLSTFYPRLVWDHRHNGLVLVFCPYGAGGTTQRAYFWSALHNAWWPMRFGTSLYTDLQPTAICTSDADDPDDRMVLFGCEDGYVRQLDGSVGYDENSSGSSLPIGSYALVGPFMAEDRIHRIKTRSLWATLAKESPCSWELYVERHPDAVLSNPVAGGRLRPGYNGRIPIRKVGLCTWLKILDSSVSTSWAIESLALEALRGDRERRWL